MANKAYPCENCGHNTLMHRIIKKKQTGTCAMIWCPCPGYKRKQDKTKE